MNARVQRFLSVLNCLVAFVTVVDQNEEVNSPLQLIAFLKIGLTAVCIYVYKWMNESVEGKEDKEKLGDGWTMA